MREPSIHLSTSGELDDEAYGASAALRYDLFEGRPTGFANQMAPQIWTAMEAAGLVSDKISILDVGCGTGQLAAYFLDRGARVTGLDRSEHMLGYARANNARHVASGQARFVRADAADFRLDERFQAATSTFNCLNHLPSHEAVEACLGRVLHALEPGGLFLFDFNTRRGLQSTVERIEVSDTETDVTVWTRRFSGDRVVLYASGCFLHAGSWQRYRETIHKIVVETERIRDTMLGQGWTSVIFTEADFATSVGEPENAAVAYVVARK